MTIAFLSVLALIGVFVMLNQLRHPPRQPVVAALKPHLLTSAKRPPPPLGYADPGLSNR